MNPISTLSRDLIALHEYKSLNNTGFKNIYLDTFKNILFLPSVWFLIVFRIGQLTTKIKPLYYLYLFFIWRPMTVITQIEIYPETEIGEGLVLPHFGQIFINPKAKIGKNCLIYNSVTIGCNFTDRGSPVIGDNVKIGAGAKIIGNITVNNNSKINANSVVSQDL
jgi:serine O-acetyltransferase